MVNLKNIENDAVFDKMSKKKKVKIKIKLKGTFLDSIPWLKSNQPPADTYILYLIYVCVFICI